MDHEIETLEESRWAALIASDVERLRSMYSPDLAYTHSNGMVDTRDGYLTPIADGTVRYLAVRRSDEQVHRHGPVAVVTGHADMDVDAAGTMLHPVMRYSAVWNRFGDAWQLICWHATGLG